MKTLRIIVAFLAISTALFAQNPYLPMWEYIPDGEPYVFEDPDNPGKYRVYVYGSHDNLVNEYCGKDQVVWSAPVEDLSAWRYDGVIFSSILDAKGNYLNEDKTGDILYAPDVAVRRIGKNKVQYYLYPNNQAQGREGMVAVSDRPDGPFQVINWSKTDPTKVDGFLGFDPAVFVDDDGKAYAYWGFMESFACALDEDMMTMRDRSLVKNMVSNCNQKGVFRFFEASSMRKIEDKYVFIYSRMTEDGEFGLYTTNYTLAYAYSDSPLGPFKYGGTLIDGRARGVNREGDVIATANPYGNTHGSLCKIGDQWWIFYHRQTGKDEFSRQAMVAPVTVSVKKGAGGKVVISEGEYNSCGFRTEGLDPFEKIEAARACYLYNPAGVGQEFPNFFHSGSFISPVRDKEATDYPVVNNTTGSVVGFKYLDMRQLSKMPKANLSIRFLPNGVRGKICVVMGKEPWSAKKLIEIEIDKNMSKELTTITKEVRIPASGSDKEAIYFIFESNETGVSLCDFYSFQFEAQE